MSDVDTNGFSNAFDERIRSISKQVIEEEFAKRQICEGLVVVDPEAIKLQHCLQRMQRTEDYSKFTTKHSLPKLSLVSQRCYHRTSDRHKG